MNLKTKNSKLRSISVSEELWSKAKSDSLAILGQENVSGYINYLIINNGSKKKA